MDEPSREMPGVIAELKEINARLASIRDRIEAQMHELLEIIIEGEALLSDLNG